ncbi:unnamed protein product, partial [Trypanosoma congolense IL3000]
MPPRHKRRRDEESSGLPQGEAGDGGDDVVDRDDYDSSVRDEEESGEDLFGENYERDYLQPDEESEVPQDEVEDDDWIDDNSDVSVISETGKLAVDALLDRRNEMERRLREEKRQLEEGVFSDLDDDSFGSAGDDDGGESDGSGDGDDESGDGDRGSGAGAPGEDDGAYVRGDLGPMDFDWRNPQCDLVEWLSQELPRHVVKNRIYNFYLNYVENGVCYYEQKVNLMTRENEQSFQLSYSHLSRVYD